MSTELGAVQDDLERWLSAAGLIDVEIAPGRGLVLFSANKPD